MIYEEAIAQDQGSIDLLSSPIPEDAKHGAHIGHWLSCGRGGQHIFSQAIREIMKNFTGSLSLVFFFVVGASFFVAATVERELEGV